MQTARAQSKPSKPLDIIFVIDNSGSMDQEIAAVRANINTSFASILAQSGADFRVIMLSQFGLTGTDVCIDPPLAGAECGAGLSNTNGAQYFHHSVVIDSINPLCKLLESLGRGDDAGRAPGGIGEYLRPDAHKAIVVITDDNAACSFTNDDVSVMLGRFGSDPFEDALAFHSALLATAPEQFGRPPDVRYQLYSFVGLAPQAAALQPYFPHEAINHTPCDTAPNAGVLYQALSVITDSLRYPVCEGRGFDSVFRVLAQNVVESVKAECSFAIPEAPIEQVIDRSTIELRYRSRGGSEPVMLEQVDGFGACTARGFYLHESEQGEQIELCPAACTRVQADASAELEVLYGCMYLVQ